MGKNDTAAFEEFLHLSEQYGKVSETGKQMSSRFLELYCLYQIAASLSDKMELHATVETVRHLFKRLFSLDHFTLLLVDEETHELRVKNHFGARSLVHQRKSFPLDHSLFGRSLQQKEPCYLADLAAAGDEATADLTEKNGALVCIPLQSDSHGDLGTILLHRGEKDSFTETELELFARIGAQISRVLDKILIYHHTKALSITDDLTRIFNRRYFNQRFEREIQRAQRYNRALSIIMVDIDFFKQFNDTYGHLVGDEVLRNTARVLEKNLRQADIVARFGGEEFVILLPETNKSKARRVAEKLRSAVEKHRFKAEGNEEKLQITVSLGVASFPEDSLKAENILAHADKALYMAKAAGRNQVGYLKDEKQAEDIPHYRFATA